MSKNETHTDCKGRTTIGVSGGMGKCKCNGGPLAATMELTEICKNGFYEVSTNKTHTECKGSNIYWL